MDERVDKFLVAIKYLDKIKTQRMKNNIVRNVNLSENDSLNFKNSES